MSLFIFRPFVVIGEAYKEKELDEARKKAVKMFGGLVSEMVDSRAGCRTFLIAPQRERDLVSSDHELRKEYMEFLRNQHGLVWLYATLDEDWIKPKYASSCDGHGEEY